MVQYPSPVYVLLRDPAQSIVLEVRRIRVVVFTHIPQYQVGTVQSLLTVGTSPDWVRPSYEGHFCETCMT
jgi:hypothetical protein